MKPNNWNTDLKRPRPSFASLISILPPDIATFIMAVADYIQCDLAIAFFAFLSVVSAALVGRVIVHPFADSSYHEAVQLYILLVADSGERKSSAMNFMITPLTVYLKQLQAQVANEAKKVKRKLNNIEESINNTIISNMQYIEQIFGDATLEGLAKAQAATGGKAIIFNGEGEFLKILNGLLYSQNGAANLMHLINSFDNEGVDIIRAGKEIHIPHASLSISLGAQMSILYDFMANNVGRGLHERFLFIIASSLAGTRSCFGKKVDPSIYNEYSARIEELAALYRNLDGKPSELHFSAEAESAYIEFFNSIEKRLGSDGDLHDEAISGWANRCRALTIRIAALISLYLDEKAVSLQSWNTAEAVMVRYLIPCAKIAFGIDGLTPIASKIGSKLIGITEISQADLFRSLHNYRGITNSAFKSAVIELEEAGLIQCEERKGSGRRGCHPSPIIHVHPQISKFFS